MVPQAAKDLFRKLTATKRAKLVSLLVAAVVLILGQEISSGQEGIIQDVVTTLLDNTFGTE